MIINKSLSKVYSDIAAVQADTDDIQVQVGVAGVGLTAITGAMALDATVAKEASLAALATQASVDVIDGIVDSILLDTAEIGVAGAGLSAIPDMALDSTVAKEASIAALATQASVDVIDGIVDSILLDTAEIGVAGAGLSAIPDMATATAQALQAVDSTVAKEASLAALALEASVQDVLTDTAEIGVAGAGLTAITTDRLDNATYGLEAIKNAITGGGSGEDKGTFSYLDAGGEQTVIELVITDRKIIQGAWLDMVNLTQDGTVKCYYKVDGANYREVSSEAFTVATDSDGWYIDLNMGVSDDFKITYTEGADEGAARNIPYAIVWQEIQ